VQILRVVDGYTEEPVLLAALAIGDEWEYPIGTYTDRPGGTLAPVRSVQLIIRTSGGNIIGSAERIVTINQAVYINSGTNDVGSGGTTEAINW
jgi:hypothetical protein